MEALMRPLIHAAGPWLRMPLTERQQVEYKLPVAPPWPKHEPERARRGRTLAKRHIHLHESAEASAI